MAASRWNDDDEMKYDKHTMPKRAISVTLDADNVVWLKGRVGASRLRSVSELLDHLVTTARQAAHVGPSRSVVGTVDIDLSDPLLDNADQALHALFDTSLGRPLVVRASGAAYVRGRAKKSRGR